MSSVLRVTVLGSTGTVGINTLDVIARHPDRFEVFALSCARRWQDLLEQCRATQPRFAVVLDESAAAQLRQALQSEGIGTEVLSGAQGMIEIAQHDECDAVMAAIVGAAGLEPTMAAAQAGKRVMLANKESLVMAGQFFMDAVRDNGAELLPIDSEHNAIFQCLPMGYRAGSKPADIRRILLTASGGPFRHADPDSLGDVTPERAIAHPNWSMGPKISVDSATMMNKGLELIEASWLFEVPVDKIQIVIHPQSIIHSMVEYRDGSTLAQMGNPDMRVPISNGLSWPERIESGTDPLDVFSCAALTFETPDPRRFPCLALAHAAAEAGGSMPIIMNAANEIAVAEFLDRRLGFTDIAALIDDVMNTMDSIEPDSIEHVKDIDAEARRVAATRLTGLYRKEA